MSESWASGDENGDEAEESYDVDEGYSDPEWSEDLADQVVERDVLPPEYQRFWNQGSASATKRLMDELRNYKPQSAKALGYSLEPIGDELYRWHIRMFDFPDSALAKDLAKTEKKDILWEVSFPEQYPFEPPFIRVIYPRFLFMTGHITSGGSFCSEVTTATGWNPSWSIEALIMQIKVELIDPKGEARLDLANKQPYGLEEAKAAFERMKRTHGWK